MNLDGMRTYRTDEAVDAVIVGTGAGGAPLLARLAAAGLKVVALEGGRTSPLNASPSTRRWRTRSIGPRNA